MIEKTFVMIKPDGVGKNIIGEILRRFESAGLVVCAAKLHSISEDEAGKLYAEHKSKDFYQGLVDLALSGPAFPMVLSGENAVQKVREIVGKTNPKLAAPGTIRYDFGREQELPANIIHASDSVQSAEREITIFFTGKEVLRNSGQE